MATFAEQREAEHQELSKALLAAAHAYAETAAPDEHFDWLKLAACTMRLAPKILLEMTGEHAMSLRSQCFFANGKRSYPMSVACVKTLLGWQALDPDWSPERMDMGITHEFLARAMITVHLFSNTPSEAAHLMCRLIMSMIESYAAEMTQGYLRQTVHDQKLLYGGPAMETIPEGERGRRDETIANMPEYYAIPQITSPLVWTAS